MSLETWQDAHKEGLRIIKALNKHKERYLRAYCLKMGLMPDELQLIQQERHGSHGLEWVIFAMPREATLTWPNGVVCEPGNIKQGNRIKVFLRRLKWAIKNF